jgi:hypothetical protein
MELLFEVDPRREIERQVDAMFAPAFSLIPERHHKLLIGLEQDMINAIKAALRLPATEPAAPDPSGWVYGSSDRIGVFLPSTQRREIAEARKRRSEAK